MRQSGARSAGNRPIGCPGVEHAITAHDPRFGGFGGFARDVRWVSMTGVSMKLVLALATTLFAANAPEFLIWKAADLQHYEETLRARIGPDHTANERLPDLDGHAVFVVHRDGTGLVEAHDTVTHMIYVISGAANLVVGGTMVDERRLAPEQLRGTSIAGGDTKRVTAGDVLYIAKVPHWFKVDAGEHITYLMINLEAP
jgi:hypothetical protein